jgi:hypothetical protein
MNELYTRLFVLTLTLAIGTGIFWATGRLYYWEAEKVKILTPNSHWQTIYFKTINKATDLVGLRELRKTSLSQGEIEIRVWRGGGLEPLEGVILKRIGGQWSAFHILTDNNYDLEKAELRELEQPRSGWESFWKQLVDREILTLPQSSENDCDIPVIDSGSYVVEINRDETYRTYRYPEGNPRCREAKLLEEIGDIIGEEFDSGNEECKRAEWFACSKARKSYKQKPQ